MVSDVAVIVPVRDGALYVAEALASLLEQSWPSAEIVVVDDGSVDGTPQILASFGDAIRVVRQSPRGFAAAVNRGVELSTGAFLAFLDADDVWPKRSLEVRLGPMAETSVDAVCGRLVQFVSPELDAGEAARLRFDPRPQRTATFNTMLIRRRAFEGVGVLDEGLVTGANIDWISRARANGVIVTHVEDTVCRRRLHRANTGRRLARTERELLPKIVRAHRRRADGPAS